MDKSTAYESAFVMPSAFTWLSKKLQFLIKCSHGDIGMDLDPPHLTPTPNPFQLSWSQAMLVFRSLTIDIHVWVLMLVIHAHDCEPFV